MSSIEEANYRARQNLLAIQEAKDREAIAWNSRESARRTQEALRQGMIRERRQWYDFHQGVAQRAYSEEELQRLFPEPEGVTGPEFFAPPQGTFVSDHVANSFGAKSLEPDEKKRLWFQMLAQTQSNPRGDGNNQMAEAHSLNMRIQERRRR